MYLARSKRGIFLVDAPHFKAAIGMMRLAGSVDEDDVPEMVTAFAEPIRDVRKAMMNFNGMPNENLISAIVEYRETCVALSWIGSVDTESHAEIEDEHNKARAEIERLVGPLPVGD